MTETIVGRATLVHGDCINWLHARAPGSVHAVVTDPPFGVREYDPEEQEKLRAGKGGVWRIPPAMGGHERMAVPRFTALSPRDRDAAKRFFATWAAAVFRVLVPGAHVFVATSPTLSHLVFDPMLAAGFEKRGEIVRLVQTLRGGDRPKGAHEEFPEVTVMPRAGWEPWGLFRKPFTGTVEENLRVWGTGGLRRESAERPFTDVIPSGRTSKAERALAPHPNLKPQAFMRQIVRAALPLGTGVVLDPFLGGGSTIAAAEALGYQSVGVERDATYIELARAGIPKLAQIGRSR